MVLIKFDSCSADVYELQGIVRLSVVFSLFVCFPLIVRDEGGAEAVEFKHSSELV